MNDSVEVARKSPCLACKKPGPSDPHHVTHRGAGGGDTEDNLMPLCRKCHARWHQEGISKFLWRYPHVKEWLMQKGRFDVIQKLNKTGGRP